MTCAQNRRRRGVGCSRDLRVPRGLARNQDMNNELKGISQGQRLPGRAAGSPIEARAAALVVCAVGAVVRLRAETSYGRTL